MVPDRKLLARLVLIREEARNMMGGGILDERNDRGLNTLPEAEVSTCLEIRNHESEGKCPANCWPKEVTSLIIFLKPPLHIYVNCAFIFFPENNHVCCCI